MTKTIQLVVAFVAGLVATLGGNVQAGVITSATNPTNGHTYALLTPNNWLDSEAEALSLGGHLVTINDGVENQWILSTFAPILSPGVSRIWLGYNDIAVEGTFVWSSGETSTYTNWMPGEPNNFPYPGGEDAAVMLGGGSWLDNPIDYSAAGVPFVAAQGIVEISAATVPEPTSLAIVGFGACVAGISVRRRQGLKKRTVAS